MRRRGGGECRARSVLVSEFRGGARTGCGSKELCEGCGAVLSLEESLGGGSGQSRRFPRAHGVSSSAGGAHAVTQRSNHLPEAACQCGERDA
jgi:hypothetical protein